MNNTERWESSQVRGRRAIEFDGTELASKIHAAAQGLSRAEIADLSEHLDALVRILSAMVAELSASPAKTIASGGRDSGSRSDAELRWAHATETDPPAPAQGLVTKTERITFDEIVQYAISLLSGTANSPSRVPSVSPGGAPTIETIAGEEMTLLRYLDPQRISRRHTPSGGGDEELLTSDQLAARVGLKTRQSVHNWLRQRSGHRMAWGQAPILVSCRSDR